MSMRCAGFVHKNLCRKKSVCCLVLPLELCERNSSCSIEAVSLCYLMSVCHVLWTLQNCNWQKSVFWNCRSPEIAGSDNVGWGVVTGTDSEGEKSTGGIREGRAGKSEILSHGAHISLEYRKKYLKKIKAWLLIASNISKRDLSLFPHYFDPQGHLALIYHHDAGRNYWH